MQHGEFGEERTAEERRNELQTRTQELLQSCDLAYCGGLHTPSVIFTPTSTAGLSRTNFVGQLDEVDQTECTGKS